MTLRVSVSGSAKIELIMNSESDSQAAYFIRESGDTFRPTGHVSGGWNPQEQHIAPAIGLLAHCIEQDFAARRDDELRLVRLSCDILGTIPMEAVRVEVSVLRPGRTIELIEARMSHDGRDAVIARAWLSAGYDTAESAGSGFGRLGPAEEFEPWQMDATWPGGFVKSVKIRPLIKEPGSVRFWLSSDVALLAGEPVSDTARLLGLIDVTNGVAARANPEEVLFPNLDLTAHLFRAPSGDWVGVDAHGSIGPQGAGLTHGILHDAAGPFGSFAQILTVRPR